jgi:hypothetical protein
MLPAKFGSIWPSSFRGEDFFLTLANQKKKSSPLKLLGQTKLGRKHLCKVLYYSKMVNLISVELCTQLMHHMKIYKKESCSHLTLPYVCWPNGTK